MEERILYLNTVYALRENNFIFHENVIRISWLPPLKTEKDSAEIALVRMAVKYKNKITVFFSPETQVEATTLVMKYFRYF